MDQKERADKEDQKPLPSKASHVKRQTRRYTSENVKFTPKLNETQTKSLSSRGKKQRQQSKLPPRG
jgi:hypothetical protein